MVLSGLDVVSGVPGNDFVGSILCIFCPLYWGFSILLFFLNTSSFWKCGNG